MPSALEVLTFPPRFAAQLFQDGRRRADAAVRVSDAVVRVADDIGHLTQDLARISANLEGVRREVRSVVASVEHVRTSLDGVQVELHDDLLPVARKLDRTSDALAALDANVNQVTEPLQPAAERFGKLAERLPGRTKRT